ncbi:MAG: glycerophosphodiester phosphodiesterase [Microthrixaceae bacterium]
MWSTPSHERPEATLDLEAALESCLDGATVHGLEIGVNIEIKNIPGDMGGDHVPRSLEVVDSVLEVLEHRSARGIHQRILISSFDPETIDRVRALGGPPTAQLVLDVNAWTDVIESTAERGHSYVHPWDPFVDEAFMDAARAAGVGVNAWTVDDPVRIVELARLGVDGIVTNVPAAARRVLESSGPGGGGEFVTDE